MQININRTYFGRIFWAIERKSHENYLSWKTTSRILVDVTDLSVRKLSNLFHWHILDSPFG